jgi:hypothetical protein
VQLVISDAHPGLVEAARSVSRRRRHHEGGLARAQAQLDRAGGELARDLVRAAADSASSSISRTADSSWTVRRPALAATSSPSASAAMSSAVPRQDTERTVIVPAAG